MSWRDPKTWLAATALFIVLLLAWRDLERTSPGPLSPSHAAIGRLAGAEGCKVCHGGIGVELAAGCAECHAEIIRQLDAGTGFHGRLIPDDPENCAHCHVEHHADAIPLSGAAAFRKAGIEQRDAFSHSELGLELEGRHSELACEECHSNANATVLADGETRFLGARFTCESCHADPHDGRMQRDCASCHDQVAEFDLAGAFVHANANVLAGPHANLRCGACHSGTTGTRASPEAGAPAIETLTGDAWPAFEEGCSACHASPHAPRVDDCSACHTSNDLTFADANANVTQELHSATGFELRTPHADLTCGACHDPSAESHQERYPGRSPTACTSCHVDPHGSQFERAPYLESGCLSCHSGTEFTRTTFDVSDHAMTSFPLLGAHQETECRACHVPIRPEGPAPLAGTDAACDDCHAGPHGEHLTNIGGTEFTCLSCHNFDSFESTSFDLDAHAQTGFDLVDSHAAVTCFACHIDDHGGPDLTFSSAMEDCGSCHMDPHGGVIGSVPLRTTPNGVVDCAECHRTSVFRELKVPFKHVPFVDFAVDGAHNSLDCSACHGRTQVGTTGARTLGHIGGALGNYQGCVTCHTDVHAGAFDAEGRPALLDGRPGCERCHSTDSFTVLRPDSFDHGLFTDFPLAGAHANVDCRECHLLPTDLTSHTGGALPAASGTDCRSCHMDPHFGQFDSDGLSDCARCHTTGPGFDRLLFDHSSDSRFLLDRQHGDLECSACHRSARLADGREAVRYRPLGLECADCHGPVGGRRK